MNTITVYTDVVGYFEFTAIPTDKVTLLLSKPGYFRIESPVMELNPGPNEC